ncbi:type I-E CRISPR-associated protein Cse1/CasA [Anthocerotibacter panamensis]|uniref:type I-E CRISPR-associated protein Cse1/CasA n=1 Tax=Anthocerotibacter panamensis TaxID=2857077 RepID=UPI001C40853C|nr:type I-E CRISPR-associated protein Cse1/CasA [Anthocerotibacter panamensis]
MSFNLTQEPWIPVVNENFERREVSLITFFETWETQREILAENPPTTLALHRFLLALMHRVYQGPRNIDHWLEIREDNGQQVIAYLQERADRFDLFHPEYPFMQDKALTPDKAVSVFALHTMSTSKVFSHEHEWSGYSISFQEAARLLIRLNAVDVSSLRSSYPPKKGPSTASSTPTINSANLLIQGSTLQETMLLNLMQYNPAGEIPSRVSGQDTANWEIGYTGIPKKEIPKGYINYLSFPWRRLCLFAENGRIKQLAITMGHSFPEEIKVEQWECHIPYRDGKPVRISLDRQLWRDAHCFLLTADKNHRPQIIDWLAELVLDGVIEDTLCFRVFGMSADKAKPLGWSVENFSTPTIYITHEDLAGLLKQATVIAEENKQAFRAFRGSPYYVLAEVLKYGDAGSLAHSLGGAARYWALLDREFTELLYKLPKDKETDENEITRYGGTCLPAWEKTVQNAAREAFTESIESIRDYRARALALRALNLLLHKLRKFSTPQVIQEITHVHS